MNEIQELKDRRRETVPCHSWGSFIAGVNLVMGVLCLRETKDVDKKGPPMLVMEGPSLQESEVVALLY
ncbi:hypothetical protein [Pseudomonas fluorescens]|uniref:Uncharacterized protein n=1 Tax=Pseudomonas fluorescens TaxID=294 RepID=A0A5E7HFV8_PSEFL|nr:hypothetical protein [Pseudomonas fluorescens]VVO62780.1 hypothetical protein PS880_00889 [Pseudomonas fluorescens]